MKKGKATFWILIAAGMTLIIALMLTANILFIGERLKRLHPVLEWSFYGIVMLMLFFLILRPIMTIFLAPSFSIGKAISKDKKEDWNFYKRIAGNMLKSGGLTASEEAKLKYAITYKTDLKIILYDLFENNIKKDVETMIVETAQKVFLITGASQSSRLDLLTVLSANFQMIKKIVARCGFRPALPGLFKLYVNVLATALLAEGLEDMELDEVVPLMGENGIAKIPGASLVFSSAMQGFSNAFLTLRIGIITREYIFYEGRSLTKVTIRKSAIKEALVLMKPTVKGIIKIIPDMITNVKEKIN